MINTWVSSYDDIFGVDTDKDSFNFFFKIKIDIKYVPPSENNMEIHIPPSPRIGGRIIKNNFINKNPLRKQNIFEYLGKQID